MWGEVPEEAVKDGGPTANKARPGDVWEEERGEHCRSELATPIRWCAFCVSLQFPHPQHFPLSFPAGDVADERSFYRLPNPVYNSLKLHARAEEQRSQRLHDKKEHATHVRTVEGGNAAESIDPVLLPHRSKLWTRRHV